MTIYRLRDAAQRAHTHQDDELREQVPSVPSWSAQQWLERAAEKACPRRFAAEPVRLTGFGDCDV